MPWLFRFFLLSSFFLVSLHAQETKLKQVGSVPVDILYAGPNDRLVLKDPRSDTLHLWEPKEQIAKQLFHWDNPPARSNQRLYAISPSGQYLILRNRNELGWPSPNEIKIMDLVSEKLDSFVISESKQVLHLPLFSNDEQNYFISTADSGKREYWTFPFAEYVEDVKNQQAQPTGFYLNPIPEKESLGNLFDGSFSPDGTEIVLLNHPVSEIELPASPLLRRSRGGNLRRIHLSTGKIKDYKLSTPAINVEWVEGNTVFLVGEEGNGLYSFNLDTEKSETYISDDIINYKTSVDYNWLWVSTFHIAKGRKDFLIHTPTQRKIELHNIASVFFTPEGDSLVVQRAQTNQGKPYLKIPISQLIDSKENSFTVSDEKELAKTFGSSIPVWEMPNDAKVFGEKFERLGIEKNKLVDMGWDVYVTFKNKSREYFGFPQDLKSVGLDCELLNDKGEVVVAYKADEAAEDEPLFFRGSKVVGPGQIIRLGCGASGDKPLSLPFTGKVKYRIHGYEKAFEGEIEVP